MGKPGSVSCGITVPFSWVLVYAKFCCAHQEFISPVLWKFVIKSHCPSKLNFLWILSPFAGSPGWKVCCGPRTFTELLWYNFSPVCGLSAWWLYSGANGDLLQENLCHTPWLQGLLQPEPLSPRQATADLCLCRRHSNTQRQVWLSLCGVSGSWCTQGFV